MKSPWDRFLPWFTAVLFGLCLIRFGLWLPGYLIRPWYADHDVFATMAQGWDSGLKPYRDLLGNNFPGTIYLFWGLGKGFGWGNVTSLYEFDAALLLILGGMMLLWSRARFGMILPGLVGVLAITSYYFRLDFALTAQRDWHAPVFVVLGLMAAQAWPNRGGRWLGALGFAVGMLIRPQVVVLLPAMLLAVTEARRLSGEPFAKTVKAALLWMGVVGLLVLLGLLPLLVGGLLGDFLNGLRLVAYGQSYNKTTLRSIARSLAGEVGEVRIASVAGMLAVLARATETGPGRSLARTWLAALVGVLFYAPLSPAALPYLAHPLWLVWSVGLAVSVGLGLTFAGLSRAFLCVLIIPNLALQGWPRFSQNGEFRRAVVALREGHPARHVPLGYDHPYPKDIFTLAPWGDYCDLLDHLRHKLGPGTRVANLLKGVAVTGPSGRLPALPAESATWLAVVNPDDEPRFARVLEDCPDSVVVWSPGVPDKFGKPLTELNAVVRRLYEPDVRFGDIEVWRRIPKP